MGEESAGQWGWGNAGGEEEARDIQRWDSGNRRVLASRQPVDPSCGTRAPRTQVFHSNVLQLLWASAASSVKWG